MIKVRGYSARDSHSPLAPFNFERRDPGLWAKSNNAPERSSLVNLLLIRRICGPTHVFKTLSLVPILVSAHVHHPFGSTLPPSHRLLWLVLTAVVVTVEQRTGAGPLSQCRSLAS